MLPINVSTVSSREESNKQLEKVQVIGLGQACVDFLGTLGAYPDEDGKVELSDLQVLCSARPPLRLSPFPGWVSGIHF